MFDEETKASRIEIQGCLYNFETPGSNIRIKFFQSAVGTEVPNGQEFLKYLKPVREMLDTNKIKDIRQLVQRELDDVRIIKSLVPYILNTENNLGQNGVAFFPSVLGVIMPKDYLKNLTGVYPSINSDKRIMKDDGYIDIYETADFNWSVRRYTNKEKTRTFPYVSLTVDTENCDVVIIDGQHRINAFRAASESMTTENDVIKQIYNGCSVYSGEKKYLVNLPITLIWFEGIKEDLSSNILPEIISRKLFIDVNNTAKSIAKSRKILLDDTNPINLITNHFYSKIASKHQFDLKTLSLAHLGCDVPTEASSQTYFRSLPFTCISTPERLRSVFDVFFMRTKSYSIGASRTASPTGRRNKYRSSINEESFSESVIKIMLPNSMSEAISQYTDEYLEREILFVNDELGSSGQTNQNFVRNEFAEQYFNCFYNLLSEFSIFKNHLQNIQEYNNQISQSGDLTKEETWKSVFLDGKSLFFTLNNKTQSENKYRKELGSLESNFEKHFLSNAYSVYNFQNKKLESESAIELMVSFRSQAFQIGIFQAFYEFSQQIYKINFSIVTSDELFRISNEFLTRVNDIKLDVWANIFSYLRAIHGEFHPKTFPVVTHMILRIIQRKGEIFDINNESKYFAPECLLFHQLCVTSIDKQVNDDFGSEDIKKMTQLELLAALSKKQNRSYQEIFSDIISENQIIVEQFFTTQLGISNLYINDLHAILIKDVYLNICVTKSSSFSNITPS